MWKIKAMSPNMIPIALFIALVIVSILCRSKLDNTYTLSRLIDKVDTAWKCFLTLIGLYIFFSYVVTLPILFLGVANPLYAYGWVALWITVASLLAYREVIRRSGTVTMPKWVSYPRVSYPKVVDEYLELIRKTVDEYPELFRET